MRFDGSQIADSGGGMPPAGAYAAEVVKAEEKVSKAGDGYISLKIRLDGVDWHVYDVLMASGKGAGMGKAKAKAFGIDFSDGAEIAPEDFVGKRATAHCIRDEYQGKPKLSVDAEQGEYCGYDVADDLPAGTFIPF